MSRAKSIYNHKRKRVTVVCPVCGDKFVKNESNTRRMYCSPACSSKASYLRVAERNPDYRKTVKELGKCEICGKEFLKKKSAHYCSPECRAVAQWARKFERRNERTPTQDEVLEFMLWRETGRVEPKTCEHCGKEFTPPWSWRKTAKYCSNACAQEAWRAAHPDTPANKEPSPSTEAPAPAPAPAPTPEVKPAPAPAPVSSEENRDLNNAIFALKLAIQALERMSK